MARMGQLLSTSKGLILIILINGTRIRGGIEKVKYSRLFWGIGKRILSDFMRRNKHKIIEKRGQKY